MTTTITDVADIRPVDRAEGLDLGEVAYQRLIDELAGLSAGDWGRPTDCTLWTVRDLAGHVAGMMWSMSTLRRSAAEQAQSARRAKRAGGSPLDAMTAIQVERMADLTTDELVDRMRELVATAVAGRRRPPEVLASRLSFPQDVDGVVEKWSMSYLLGPIVTRDTWLHRVADLARAVDRPPALDPDHDGRIVADVVAEWARRHGAAFELTLTGPAGGSFRSGTGGPSLEVDAIEFCRMLSGRAEPNHELLETQVPF